MRIGAAPIKLADPAKVHIVGRDRELDALLTFLSRLNPPGALALFGDPGMGKSTLWDAGITMARQQGSRVLTARPSDAEMQLSFSAIADLLDGVDESELVGVPSPQLSALKVALFREDATEETAEPHAVAAAVLSALRALAATAPLLVAIDDVQWLDQPSSEAMTFAARRLEDESVTFLFSRRRGKGSSLERALDRKQRLERLEIGPLSLGAIRRMLFDRLGLSLPRRIVSKIFDVSLGNPLFALELGRSLAEAGLPEIGQEIVLPDEVEVLLGERVDALPSSSRNLLLAVALTSDLRRSQLEKISTSAELDDAVDAGVLVIDGDRVRASHPLLAAAALQHSSVATRRTMHLRLAETATTSDHEARHLGLATDHPDKALSAAVAEAANRTAVRGAAPEAVELAEHAVRLTPPGSPERSERVLRLAALLDKAGEPSRVADLLNTELGDLPAGSARVQALVLLSEAKGPENIYDHEAILDWALEEARGDPVLRAPALAKKAIAAAKDRVEQLREAEGWALEALEAAPRGEGGHLEQVALVSLAWARALRGQSVDDLARRSREVPRAALYFLMNSSERVAAVRLTWRGEVAAARKLLERLMSEADEYGEGWSYPILRLHLCDLELRAGNWDVVEHLLDEWEQSTDREIMTAPSYERCRSYLALGRGFPEEAERWAAHAIEGCESMGVNMQLYEGLRCRAAASLLAGRPANAVEPLNRVWEHMQREGVGDPGVFPVVPDLVEALTELGELERARTVTARLKKLAKKNEHPWGIVTAKRCDAIVRLAAPDYDEKAGGALASAAVTYGEMGLGFDRARCLLAAGRAQRRRRKWGAARGSLEQAVAAFEELGSPGWVERAKEGLSRVGGRKRSATGELTAAESRVAELAAQGLSNKEIAQSLFVTVGTVELHLSRVYAKLGIRSRSQLASRLPGRD